MEVTSRFVPDYIMPSPAAVLRAVWKLATTASTCW
jgi:ABC-type nitrate/sulfonate/bicarbonate transport system permease component